jgi:hypothetical protein
VILKRVARVCSKRSLHDVKAELVAAHVHVNDLRAEVAVFRCRDSQSQSSTLQASTEMFYILISLNQPC